MSVNILGISCFYHDAAAALIRDGVIIAAAQEDRFTRIKHDPSFPINAIMYCLEEGEILPAELDYIVFYDKPLLTFDRLLSTYLHVAPRGIHSWFSAMSRWLEQKFFIPNIIRKNLHYKGRILFTEHHMAHAASAFYPSPFSDAAIITVDGVGEWATTTFGIGEANYVSLLGEQRFPHSLGLLYSAFTYFCGFKVNSGEYKLMGLAPYGKPKYADLILEEVVDLKEDGSIRLNMEYFGYLSGLTMVNDKFSKLFNGPPRQPESNITRQEIDLASSIQLVLEKAMLNMANHVYRATGRKNLCIAGGVALNCVSNGRILRESPFEKIWIQPAAGDAGGALGAALLTYYGYLNNYRQTSHNGKDYQQGSYLGPSFSKSEIKAFLDTYGYPYHELKEDECAKTVAGFIADGKVVGYFSGRMEFGPRALGARSILGNAQRDGMQSKINLKIKYRESFRPFAPSVLSENVSEYFEFEGDSPYMLLVAPVAESLRKQREDLSLEDDLLPLVNMPKSDIPAVTHWDYSARIQTVGSNGHSEYHKVISAVKEITGCAVVVNTSFNVRGEPIVCTPENAYRCFMRTEIDALYLDGFWLLKEEQPEWKESVDWQEKFVLD